MADVSAVIVDSQSTGDLSNDSNTQKTKQLPMPAIEIRYKNLSYAVMLTEAQTKSVQIPSVAKAIAGIFTAPFKGVHALLTGKAGSGKTKKVIIDRVSGVIKPGTLTLLLAPPGHGKSAFLKLITRQCPPSTMTGEITYSGSSDGKAEGCHLPQLVQYVNQLDEHLPHLTVRETLEFVAANATVDPAKFGYPEHAYSSQDFVNDAISLLHLQNCERTMIGNELLRGVSGGEKKRVTVGEGLCTHARMLALDEISTGLDSAVTYDIVASLRDKAKRTGLAAVIALLQPTPEVFDLFDDVVLLREGCVVYHGPRAEVGSYLSQLGFQVPESSNASKSNATIATTAAAGVGAVDVPTNNDSSSEDEPVADRVMDLADWLIAMLTDPQRMMRKSSAAIVDASQQTHPHSPEEMNTARMVQAWNASALNTAMMSAPMSVPPLHLEGEWAKAQYGYAYVHSFVFHLWLLMKRQFLLMHRNPLYVRARLSTAVIMGVVLGGLYFQLDTANGLTYYGAFLNALMNAGFGNLGEMAVAVEQKFVAYKHVSHGNYPGGAFVLAGTFAHLPLSILVNLVHVGIVYGMSGMTPGAGHFFFMLLVCVIIDVFFRNMLVLFCYAFRSVQAAQNLPMPVIALLILFAGFLVAPAKMGWLEFLYYVDVLGYGLRSLAQNEFLSDRYDRPVSGTTETLGEYFLSVMGIRTERAWMWGGVGFAVGAALMVILGSLLVFSIVRQDNNIGSQRVDSTAATKQAMKKAKSKHNVQAVNAAVAPTVEEIARQQSDIVRSISMSKMKFQPMTVVFKDMKYTVKLAKHAGGGKRTLLHGITGYALPGRMLALMGASGAGKTTLLDVLAGRKNSGKLEGSILLNGFPKDERTFNRVAAYVEQMDIHAPLTTVREAVEFSAKLRLPSSVSSEARHEFVAEILQLLELSDIQNRMVGVAGEANSLAPGERKRLSIAVELASNASVVFLDEPTSGLDARAAEIVMRVVRKIADTGRTIICTIHQPSAELFFMFDDLLLMQRGGYQVYLGPLGPQGQEIVSFLSAFPGFPAYPAGMNPSSWMLDGLGGYGNTPNAASPSPAAIQHQPSHDGSTSEAVSAAVMVAVTDVPAVVPSGVAEVTSVSGLEAPSATTEHADDVVASPNPSPIASPPVPSAMTAPDKVSHAAFQTFFHKSAQFQTVQEVVAKHGTPAAGTQPVSFPSRHARSLFTQYWTLVGRFWTSYSRNVGHNVGRWGALTFLFILFGIVYLDIAEDATDIPGTQTLIAGIFLTIAFAAMLNKNTSLPPTIQLRAVMYREVSSYMYDTIPFNLAHTSVEIPWLLLITLATVPISYFMFGLSSSAGVFFFHYLVTSVLTLVFVLLGYVLATALPNFEVAQAASGIIAPLFFLFGGLWAPPSEMVAGARWVCWIDPITYAFRAVIPTHFYCEGVDCPTITVVNDDVLTDEDRYTWIARKYDIDYNTRWENLGYLAIFIIVFQLAVILATRYVRHISR